MSDSEEIALYKKSAEYASELANAEQIGYEKGIAELRARNKELTQHLERLIASSEALNNQMDQLWQHIFFSRIPRKTRMQKLVALFTI